MKPAAFALSLAALSMTASASAASPLGLEPPVLRVSLESEPATLDWNAFKSEADRFVISFLMRGLLKYDDQAKPVCDLCREFKVSADGRTLTFELENAKWSDGTQIEARHFVDSFERLLNPANRFSFPEDLKLIEGATQPRGKWSERKLGVRAVSATKLEISLSRGASTLPYLLTTVSTFPIRKEQLSGTANQGQKHAQAAVLGPYALAEWSPGKRIVLEGNPQYRGTRPVYRVEFILGPHPTLIQKFKSGRLEILSRPTTDDVLKLPGQKVQVNPYWATRALFFNVTQAPLGERNLRRAILHSLDRDALPALLGSGERKATGLIPPGLQGYRDLPLVSADLPLAEQELKAAMAGAQPGTVVLLARDTVEDRKVAGWLSTRLARLKITVKPEHLTAAHYSRRLESGEFGLALQTLALDTANPLEVLRAFRTGSPRNPGKWTHVAFDGLVDQMLEGQKPEQFAALLEKATQLLEAQEVGVIPLGYPALPFLLSSRVSSFATTPFGDPDLVRIQLRQIP